MEELDFKRRFKVSTLEIYERTVIVEAENVEEAIEIASSGEELEKYHNHENSRIEKEVLEFFDYLEDSFLEVSEVDVIPRESG